jgi:hypothetical protein
VPSLVDAAKAGKSKVNAVYSSVIWLIFDIFYIAYKIKKQTLMTISSLLGHTRLILLN